MSAQHDLYLDLVAAAAVGALDLRDQATLEAHLRTGCAECLALQRDLGAPVEALARSVPAARPSRGLKARVMVAVAGGAAAEGSAPDGAGPGPGGSGRAQTARIVAVALALTTALAWWQARDAARERDEARERLAACEARAPALPNPDEEWARFVARHPRARALDLAPTEKGDPRRRVRVAYDPASRRALVTFEGFEAPAGKDFELWTIRDGKPSSEGLVRAGPDGRAVLRVENTGDPAALSAFAVSVEALGGSPDRRAPAGDVMYAVAVS